MEFLCCCGISRRPETSQGHAGTPNRQSPLPRRQPSNQLQYSLPITNTTCQQVRQSQRGGMFRKKKDQQLRFAVCLVNGFLMACLILAAVPIVHYSPVLLLRITTEVDTKLILTANLPYQLSWLSNNRPCVYELVLTNGVIYRGVQQLGGSLHSQA